MDISLYKIIKHKFDQQKITITYDHELIILFNELNWISEFTAIAPISSTKVNKVCF